MEAHRHNFIIPLLEHSASIQQLWVGFGVNPLCALATSKTAVKTLLSVQQSFLGDKRINYANKMHDPI